MSTAWPHLNYLADFMEVSTTPLRWKFLRGNEAERSERLHRTNVAILDFPSSERPIRRNVTTDGELKKCLNDKSIKTPVRLIVVDLSRQVVEILGSKFDIDPAFFREHINHYSWYNIRDRWMIPPNLKSVIGQQKWTRVRFVRLIRYFKTKESFQRAREESNRFNVLRRLDDDQNQWTFMDGEAVVALTRTRALLWVGTNHDQGQETIGMYRNLTIVL
jgi:hypothetical protein